MLIARPRTALYLPGQKPPIGTPLDTEHPLAFGLVGAWALNEGSPRVYNAAQPTEAGVVPVTGGTSTPSWGIGKYGSQLTFSGTTGSVGDGQAIPVGTNSRYQLQSQSIAIWVRTGSINSVPPHGSGYSLLTRSADITAGGYEWAVNHNTFSPRLGFAFYNGSVQGWYLDTTVLSDTTEYFFAATWTSGTVRFYINGVFNSTTATGTGTITNLSADSLLIGFQASTSAFQNSSFDGQMHQVLLYNRVLSDGDVAALHAEPFQMYRQRDAGRFITLVSASTGISGSGGITIGPLSLAASGLEAFSGTGALSISHPVLSSSGTEIFTASGTFTIGPPVLSGTGAEAFSGTGALSISHPVLDGLGSEVFSATAAITIGHPSLAASGLEAFTGTGDVTIGHPVLDGTGFHGSFGTGAVIIGPPALAAIASEIFSGSGASTIGPPSIAGAGAEAFSGTAAIIISHPSLAAGGAVGDVIDGSASITISHPTLAAAGLETFLASGGISITAPSLAALAAETFTGSGALTIGHPALASFGTVGDLINGVGGILIGPLTLNGAGAQSFTASGAIAISGPTLASSGLIAFAGTGGIAIAAPILTASGLVLLAVVGSGGIVISGPTISGSEFGFIPAAVLTVSGRTRGLIVTARMRTLGVTER